MRGSCYSIAWIICGSTLSLLKLGTNVLILHTSNFCPTFLVIKSSTAHGLRHKVNDLAAASQKHLQTRRSRAFATHPSPSIEIPCHSNVIQQPGINQYRSYLSPWCGGSCAVTSFASRCLPLRHPLVPLSSFFERDTAKNATLIH